MARSMVEELLSLRQRFDLVDVNGRKEFLIQLDQLIAQQQFVNQPLDLLNIFRREEIERLLKESLFFRYDYGVRIVSFVAQTGYKDEPDVDANGRPWSSRSTALHHAAILQYSHSNPVVQDLFKIYHRFDVNYTDPESGLTHIHIACKFGCEEVVQRFLELGQDPNLVATDTVDPPLHLALIFGHENVTRLLLENRANPNLTDKFGSTVLHLICGKHNDDVHLMEMLFDTRAKDLIQVDAKDVFSQTPLHLAANYGNINVAKILLEKGADPNSTNREGRSPLHIICAKEVDDDFADKFFEMCEDVKKTVNIHAQDTDGNTPLHLALDHGLINAAEVLVEKGADLLFTNEKGVTPLHNGCKRYVPNLSAVSRAFFKKAFSRPSNIDVQDSRGNTAYHLALRNGHKQTALWLAASGANTIRANEEGLTPLHTVCQRCDLDGLIQILISINKVECKMNFRAKVTTRDRLGRTALDCFISRLLPNEGNGQLTPFHFAIERYSPYPYGAQNITMICKQKMDATCDVLNILGHFLKRGCPLSRSQILMVFDFFHRYGLFKRPGEFAVNWYDDQEFVKRAQRIIISPELSLNDLVRLPLKEASSSRVIDFGKIPSMYLTLKRWPKGPKDACIVHFCEIMSWSFFREWALYCIRSLISNPLLLATYSMILNMLEIRDFYKICCAGGRYLP